ncbi:glycosyltransferase [Reichenbachiella sp. MALMAid0571]|uniref:glycosyltransferase n=1 Tax=Reichenbachiella sp. MALMAid0571 TaxID=3143939 RepID=UPI0032DF7155
MNKKILYLSYDGITDPLGQSQILPYLKGLSQKGYFFYLVGFEKKDAYKKQKEVIEKEIKGFGIQWIPKKYHKSPPVLSTLYDLWEMKKTAAKIVSEENIKIVHCRSYITMLVGLYLKRKFNIKLLFDMRGFWADERVDGKIWNLKNPLFNWIYNYFKKKEIEFVQESDHIISLTYAGKEEMVSGNLFADKSVKIDANKISVIPCATDLDLFDPEKVSERQVNECKLKLGITASDKTLIYLGSLGTWYLVKEMLEFYKAWKALHPEYKFLFVTKDDMQEVHQYCVELDIKTTNILHAIANRHEVPTYLKLADLGIFFIKPAYSKKASSAVKMGEMLAMRLPFVTNTGVGDVELELKEIHFAQIIDLDKGIEKDILFSTNRILNFDSILSRNKKNYSNLSAITSYSNIYNMFE